MILVIRISGLVEMNSYSKETLFRLHLRKKYSAIIMKDGPETDAYLQAIRNFVAYGPIDAKTMEELVANRGQSPDGKKVDSKKVTELIQKSGLDKSGIKPFFRLHPPRKGINSKDHYPKGILGDNGDKINALARRML